jgi:hypothetical protein
VKGFTCVTCAVGLEVMLRQQKGVTRANASYRENKVVIGFDANLTTESRSRILLPAAAFLWPEERCEALLHIPNGPVVLAG